MRVWLSPLAARYVRDEANYLRQFSRSAAQHFVEQIKDVRKHLSMFAEAGFVEDGLPIPGIRRLIRGGYRFGYRVSRRS